MWYSLTYYSYSKRLGSVSRVHEGRRPRYIFNLLVVDGFADLPTEAPLIFLDVVAIDMVQALIPRYVKLPSYTQHQPWSLFRVAEETPAAILILSPCDPRHFDLIHRRDRATAWTQRYVVPSHEVDHYRDAIGEHIRLRQGRLVDDFAVETHEDLQTLAWIWEPDSNDPIWATREQHGQRGDGDLFSVVSSLFYDIINMCSFSGTEIKRTRLN